MIVPAFPLQNGIFTLARVWFQDTIACVFEIAPKHPKTIDIYDSWDSGWHSNKYYISPGLKHCAIALSTVLLGNVLPKRVHLGVIYDLLSWEVHKVLHFFWSNGIGPSKKYIYTLPLIYQKYKNGNHFPRHFEKWSPLPLAVQTWQKFAAPQWQDNPKHSRCHFQSPRYSTQKAIPPEESNGCNGHSIQWRPGWAGVCKNKK